MRYVITITSGTQIPDSLPGYRPDRQLSLQERQQQHLALAMLYQHRPCLHDSCPDCIGTGVKLNGGICVHNLSCGCGKCSPSY